MLQLERIWEDLEVTSQRPVHRRFDETHPIDFYAGLDADGARSLLLVGESEPPVSERRFRAFELTAHHRADGRWALSVRLRKSELARLFAALCQDLVDSARHSCRPADAAAYVTNRIIRWEQLLVRDRGGLLDEPSLRGLVGELLFLEQFALPAGGPRFAASAWYGPLDADQDFHFPDRLVEVKTAGAGSLRVVISSAEQLDVHVIPLFLSVVSIESGQPHAVGGISVHELVKRLRGALQRDATALMEFEERLALAGYADRREYEERFFIYHGARHFSVVDGFPAIRRSALSAPFGSVKYELDLAQCSPFETSTCL